MSRLVVGRERSGLVGSWVIALEMGLEIKDVEGGACFGVKVVPGSSRTRIGGVLGSVLKIQVAAAPEKGKANKELTGFLSKVLGRPKSAVQVMTGATSVRKEIFVGGMTGEELGRALAELVA